MAKRRSNGEGHFKKHPNGKWEWQVMIGRDKNGKPIRRSFYALTKKEARRLGEDYIEEYGNGSGNLNGFISFSEWADKWYAYIEGTVTITTYESYKYTLRILKDYFKDTPICEIKAIDIETMLKTMAIEGKSTSYTSKIRGMLHQIFRKAEANEMISRNPVALADRLRRPRQLGDEEVAKKDSFTADEIFRLNKYLPDDRVGWSIRLMLGTGMRTQELLALQPEHIALDGSWINIHQAVVMHKGTAVIGPTKTKESYRTIPVPPNLRKYAVKMRNTDREFCWYGTKTPFINPSTFRDYFKEALEEIGGVRILTPHCCRHTYVSQLQSQGVDIETIMAMTGHTKLQTTERYLHVQSETKDNAVAQLNVLFAS
ncbi:MAG: site-specific integrase [Clostridia bacterium]|nr:site-specific integrase [Clostridia bacterium]